MALPLKFAVLYDSSVHTKEIFDGFCKKLKQSGLIFWNHVVELNWDNFRTNYGYIRSGSVYVDDSVESVGKGYTQDNNAQSCPLMSMEEVLEKLNVSEI